MPQHRRRRLIVSGSFGGASLRKEENRKECRKGLMTVKRMKERSGEQTSLNISYCIYRPDLLQTGVSNGSRTKKPLLVIHGGPGIPSDYLQPSLTANPQGGNGNVVGKERCIIFFDQIGCGDSSSPSDKSYYSISNTVDDLEKLICHLKLQDFHLYGHSYGGIIAFEYYKRYCSQSHKSDVLRLCSVTLCSAPSHVRLVEEDSMLLMNSFDENQDDDIERLRSNSNCSSTSSISRTDDGRVKDSSADIDTDDFTSTRNIRAEDSDKSLLFQRNYVCRTITNDGIPPPPLQEAFSKMGKVYSGTDVIIDYVARPMLSPPPSKRDAIPVLLVRGEYDFVRSKYGFDGWKKLVQHDYVFCETLLGSSHYCMVEKPLLHSSILNSFLDKCEKKEGIGQEEGLMDSPCADNGLQTVESKKQ